MPEIFRAFALEGQMREHVQGVGQEAIEMKYQEESKVGKGLIDLEVNVEISMGPQRR